MKKGQVTVFIIIGILVLMIFAMVFYFRNEVKEKDIQNTIDRIRSLFREQGKYHQYVQNCISQATTEALVISGRQGGAIYDYQVNGTKQYLGPPMFAYGEYVLPDSVEANAYNVSYGIYRPVLGSQFHPDIPFYPYGLTSLVTNPRVISPFYVNVFGNFPRSPLIPLCDYNGANRLSLSSTMACETYDSRAEADNNNIQQYLEAYIENRTSGCVRLETLPELENMNVRKGNVTANITFAENDIEVHLEMPILIEVGAYEAEIQLDTFEISKRLRLKKVHELVAHLIERDINDIYFDIVRDAGKLTDCKDITGGNSRCLKQGMFVSKVRNPYRNSSDDLLVITDREYKLEGIPYTFQVAIDNRVPALDLIRDEVGAGSFHFDYVVFAGDTIEIDPTGIDPDEDQHNHIGEMEYTYNYYGWKETEDAYFNCVSGCSIQDESNVVTFESPLHLWTKSALYNATRRKASYRTVPGDLGVHTLKVEVCDEAGLCDYQAVIILVINGTFAGGVTKYLDVGAGKASIEDPYTLVTPITFDLYPGETGLRYEWNLQRLGASTWSQSTVTPNVSFPQSGYSILDIESKMAPYFPAFGNYSIQVDILRPDDTVVSTGDPNWFNVYECLPHRSISPPYPYQTIDPFMANHSCCNGDPTEPDQLGWGTVKDSSSVCYTAVEYGCREDGNYTAYPGFEQSVCSEPDVSCLEPASPIYSDGFANDVYKRTFTRKCDGTRGNICTGDMLDTRENVKECPECQACTYGSQGCSDIPSGTTICNSGIRQCTMGEGYSFDTVGPWSCQGMCLDGYCNESVNCECDSACGAGCKDPTSYVWSDMECTFGCNKGALKNCQYKDSETTRCSSPDPLDSECYTDAGGMVICPSDSGYFADIDSVLPGFSTYCLDGDYCYYDVGCNGTGVSEEQGEECLAAGTVDSDKCYYNPDGAVQCMPDGNCSYYDVWDLACDEGSYLTGDCRLGEKCYNTSCKSLSGWEKTPDEDIELGGATYQCSAIGCSMGYKLDSGICYSGMECAASGWDYGNAESMPASTCPPSKAWVCTSSGWTCI